MKSYGNYGDVKLSPRQALMCRICLRQVGGFVSAEHFTPTSNSNFTNILSRLVIIHSNKINCTTTMTPLLISW